MESMRLAAAVCLSACSFHPPGELGPGESMVTITDDTAADFSGTRVDALVATRGAIEPDAFALGGLRATSYLNNHIMDTSHYADVIAALPAPVMTAYRQIGADWMDTDRPHDLGLTSNDNFTITYDGEIALPAGDFTLSIDADDRAIVQLALDGTTYSGDMFTHNAKTDFAIHTDTAGWVPLRAVYGEEGGNARFLLSINGVAVTRDQLRSRIGGDHALIAYGFASEVFALPTGETSVPAIDASYGNAVPPPFDLVTMPATQFAIRFAGQLLVDDAASYTFTADVGTEAGDGFRIWIDGTVVASHWAGMTDTPTSAPIALAAGWHDVLVDYGNQDMTAQVHFKIAGPDGNAAVVPSDHLRPTVAFGHTIAFFDRNSAGYPLADAVGATPGVTDISLPITPPAGAVIDAVDVGYGLFNARSSDLVTALEAGAPESLPPPLATNGTFVFNYYPVHPGYTGQPLPTTPWRLEITDNVPGGPPPMPGSAGPIALLPVASFLYHGGPDAPFAPMFSYTSPPRETPGAIRLGAVHVTADLRGAAIAVSVRTAANDDALAAAPWVDVTDGDTPAADAGEALQYRLVITGDGWQFPSIDKIAIDYVIHE
jgi:hypothetical protein